MEMHLSNYVDSRRKRNCTENRMLTSTNAREFTYSRTQTSAWQNGIYLKYLLTWITIEFNFELVELFSNYLSTAAKLLTPFHQESTQKKSNSKRDVKQHRWDLTHISSYSEIISNHHENLPIKDKVTQKIVSNSYGPKRHRRTYDKILSETTKGNQSKESREDILLNIISTACLFLIVFFLNNAPPCDAFSDSKYNNYYFDYNYPIDSKSSVTPYRTRTSFWIPRNLESGPRQLNYDSMISTALGRLNLDPSNSQPDALQSPASQSWTSFLNPFNNNNNNNQARPQSVNDSLDRHVRRILVPRVSGTQGNIDVRNYILDVLNRNNYHTELDEFEQSTPIGKVKFANIIARSNPNACRMLVLACHYDSKMMNGFLGATDSAVPCAMLLKIAETFNKSFRPKDNEAAQESLGLELIFFDGEEAFVQWTNSDSLYGSRHLAEKWSKDPAPQQCRQSGSSTKKLVELDRIELFVLLDLIGASDTSFVQYNSAVKRHYQALQKYEKEHILKNKPNLTQLQVRRESAFKSQTVQLEFVQDDHVPFKQRGVPILLLLSHPFPGVWHTVADNYEAIDFARTRRILHVLEQFVANYS